MIDPGPVLFRQERYGLDGKRFSVYKFRSMRVLEAGDQPGLQQATRNDPRVTRVGRLLRRLSFDELPQLFNVLKGDMSMVGPRPGLPEEVAAYPFRAMARLAVKPGITGIWQVSGRAEINAWLDKAGEPKAGLSLLVDDLVTLKGKPRPVEAEGQERATGQSTGQHAGHFSGHRQPRRPPRPAPVATGPDFDDELPDFM